MSRTKSVAVALQSHHPTLARFRTGMTVALGVGIPLLSLALSKMAGTLALEGQPLLSAFAFLLMVSVLVVSLSHLAWAVGDITSAGPKASWALAVSLDLTLVLCELVRVFSPTGLDWMCLGLMACVAAASMALNVYAFLLGVNPCASAKPSNSPHAPSATVVGRTSSNTSARSASSSSATPTTASARSARRPPAPNTAKPTLPSPG